MMDKTKFIKSSIKYKGKFLSYYENEFEISNIKNNNKISWECVDYNSRIENKECRMWLSSHFPKESEVM